MNLNAFRLLKGLGLCFATFCIGWGCNLLVRWLNGGMPANNVIEYGFQHGVAYLPITAWTKLPLLADIYNIGAMSYSVGDFVMAGAWVAAVVVLCIEIGRGIEKARA